MPETEMNQARILLDRLQAARTDDSKPFTSRVRIGATHDLVLAAFAATRQKAPELLLRQLELMQKNHLINSDGEIVSYMTSAMLAITRALLLQAQDPELPDKPNPQATTPEPQGEPTP